MAIERTITLYDGPGGPFEGMAVADSDWGDARPGVMIVPNVLGPKEMDFDTAERIAGLGYHAFVADLYGQGNRATREDEDPARFMNALNADRALLRDRLHASLAAMRSLDGVDTARLAAIGFCFGGKSVLDLARSGAEVSGVVSFHGIYDPPPFANADVIPAKILVCHGWDDPLAPPEAVTTLAVELTAAGVDWQIHAYGHTGHAFTDESAKMPDRGLAYQPDADRRSWKAMTDFLGEIFA
ncbi:MAG: dienelactone hydrolase family protein [Parasphingopyxis sp.]|uniref:dienelactone hydrolase family protein n=1 Tax=Parasphingopyxis sp. TaxID=1920299 RepID=UPI003FA038A5